MRTAPIDSEPVNYCSHPLNARWARRLGLRWDDGARRGACRIHDDDYRLGGSLWAKTKADGRFAGRLVVTGASLIADGHVGRGAWIVAAAPLWWLAVATGGLFAWRWNGKTESGKGASTTTPGAERPANESERET